MMSARIYKSFLIIFICFIVDSTIGFFLPYNYAKTSLTLVPYLGLMMFSLLVKELDGPDRYFFAVVCGVYYSVVYSNSLAIYVLIYCLIAFVRSYIIKIESFSMIEASVFCISTICVGEIVVYWLMWITNMTNYPMWDFTLMRLLPTLALNFVLSFLVYWLYNKIEKEVLS